VTIDIGYHASHEQFAPGELLDHLRRAEDAGFTHAMCSDHFHPWSEDQGQSGYAWSWLGAALEATSLPLGTVCAPGQRYHPAVVAQAAATLEEMYPGRFWLGLGSGEALNEHITGERWPTKEERNARLRSSADVIRALWRGETVNARGFVVVEDARLYTRPPEPPPIVGAALTPETAQWVAGWADGLVTVAQPTEDLAEMVAAFRAGGGDCKPLFLQVQLSYGLDDADSLTAAHREWRTNTFASAVLADLRLPEDFAAAAEHVEHEHMREAVMVGADLDGHIERLREFVDLGFSRIYLHNVHRDQQRFIRDFGAHVIPEVVT